MIAPLALEDVDKRYWRGERAYWLLRGVTLAVGAGEMVSVVAARNQGKTTLVRIAAGMAAPEGGRVLLAGHDPSRLSNRAHARLMRECVGIATRGGAGIDMRTLDYVAMRVAVGSRRRWRELQSLARQALKLMGAGHCAARRWEELSNLERAQVELARALAGEPQLLLIDDVLDGLGMRETDELARLVRAQMEDRRIGALMAVSDPEAALCSHRVLSLADGRLTPLSPAPPPTSSTPTSPTPDEMFCLHGSRFMKTT